MLLIISRDDQEIQVLPLREGTITLDRDSFGTSPVVQEGSLPDPMEIQVEGGRAFVRVPEGGGPSLDDLGRFELVEGSAVRFGRFAFAVRRPASPAIGAMATLGAEDDEDDGLDGVFSQALGRLFGDDDDDDGDVAPFDLSLPPGGLSIGGVSPPVSAPPRAAPAVVEAPTPAAAAEAAPTLRFVVVEGADAGKIAPVVGEGLFVGSADGMDLPLKDPQIARRHVAIQRRDGMVRFKDLVGDGRVLRDGAPLAKGDLYPGEVLQIGATFLRFEQVGGAPRIRPRVVDTPAAAPAPAAAPSDAPEEDSPSRRWVWGLAAGALLALGGGAWFLTQGPSEPQVQAPAPVEPAVAFELEWRVTLSRALIDVGLPAPARAVASAAPAVEAPARAQLLLQEERATVMMGLGGIEGGLEQALTSGDAEKLGVFYSARGKLLLKEAEQALLAGQDPGWTLEKARRAEADLRQAGWLLGGDSATQDAAERAARVVGRLLVQVDRVRQDIPRLSVEEALAQVTILRERGDLDGATVVLTQLGQRAVDQLTDEQREQVQRQQNQVALLQKAVVGELLAQAQVAQNAGDLLTAAELVRLGARLWPGSKEVAEATTTLAPWLQERAEKLFGEGRALERSRKTRQAGVRYWQVLEYVPDQAHPIHKKARARLDEMAVR